MVKEWQSGELYMYDGQIIVYYTYVFVYFNERDWEREQRGEQDWKRKERDERD